MSYVVIGKGGMKSQLVLHDVWHPLLEVRENFHSCRYACSYHVSESRSWIKYELLTSSYINIENSGCLIEGQGHH